MKFIAFIASLFIRGLHATLRMRHVHAEHLVDTPQSLIAFWHCHLLLMLHTKWHGPSSVMISQSKDGEYIARVFDWYGVGSVRGSSTRGGAAALREIIREARVGKNIVFTPDGPKGPARIVKEGVVAAARATGLPIVPIAFAAKKKKLLRSWDRMVIPIPFTRALFLYGEPIVVPRDADMEEWRLRIEERMNSLADEAERDFDALWNKR